MENSKEDQEQLSSLGQRILKHWEKYRSKQVKHLKAAGELRRRVEEAAEQHAWVSEEAWKAGLGPDQGDELAREDWMTPESRSRARRP